jgi:hypothetical protein
MVRMTPLQKQSKREQKEYHAKQRGSWNGLCPVTRTVPNGKGYDRNRDKRKPCCGSSSRGMNCFRLPHTQDRRLLSTPNAL